MIKFFRKIRYDLIGESKTGKYLKYAIGEIILVMIGILLALQINNWNEHRKDRVKEQVVLKQLKEDYKANLIQLEEKMTTRKMLVNSGFYVLSSIDQPEEVYRDSLINNLAVLTSDPTFDPIQNDLITSGNLRLITNVRLKRILSNWSSDIVALKEIEVIWSHKIYEQLEPHFNKLGLGREITNSWLNIIDHQWLLDDNTNATKAQIGTSKHKIPTNKILNDKDLEGLVSDAISYNMAANIQSEALVKRINEIINLVENEIK